MGRIYIIGLIFCLSSGLGAQNLQEVIIDDKTGIADKKFPFDEQFTISYKILKSLEVEEVVINLLRRGEIIDYHNHTHFKTFEIKDNKEKKELKIYMPPLPPGEVFSINIFYENKPDAKLIDAILDYSLLYNNLKPITARIVNNNYRNLHLAIASLERSISGGSNPSNRVISELEQILLEAISTNNVYYSSRYSRLVINNFNTLYTQDSIANFINSFVNSNFGVPTPIPLGETPRLQEALRFLAHYSEIMSPFVKYRYRGNITRFREAQFFPSLDELVRVWNLLTPSIITNGVIQPINDLYINIDSICCDFMLDLTDEDYLKSTFYIHYIELLRINETGNLGDYLRGIKLFGKDEFQKDTDSHTMKYTNITKNISYLKEYKKLLNLIKVCSEDFCTSSIEDYKSSITSMINLMKNEQGVINANRNLILHLINNIGTHTEPFEIIGGGTLVTNYKTAVKNIVQPDVGIATMFTLNPQPGQDFTTTPLVRPYYGLSINFRSAKNSRYYQIRGPFTRLTPAMWLRYHLSLDIGLTIGPINKENKRKDLFEGTNIMTGLAFRLPFAGLKFGGGIVLYQQVHPNPLIDETYPMIMPYAALKVDISVKEVAGALGSFFFK